MSTLLHSSGNCWPPPIAIESGRQVVARSIKVDAAAAGPGLAWPDNCLRSVTSAAVSREQP